MQPSLNRNQRVQLAITLLAVCLVACYAVVAIFAQPVAGLVDESDRGVARLSGHPDSYDTGLFHLYAYVDGGTFTITKWVINTGFVPLTITGVDPAPDDWGGLLGVKDTRQGVSRVPGKCCAIDETATWSAPSFRPLRLDPGQSGAVSIRYLTSHCENNSPGVTLSFPVFNLQYNILGIPRDVEIPWSFPVGVTSPDTCPRPRPVLPAG